jgi:hypothetical protein
MLNVGAVLMYTGLILFAVAAVCFLIWLMEKAIKKVKSVRPLSHIAAGGLTALIQFMTERISAILLLPMKTDLCPSTQTSKIMFSRKTPKTDTGI